jgi:hypothetical protein
MDNLGKITAFGKGITYVGPIFIRGNSTKQLDGHKIEIC